MPIKNVIIYALAVAAILAGFLLFAGTAKCYDCPAAPCTSNATCGSCICVFNPTGPGGVCIR